MTTDTDIVLTLDTIAIWINRISPIFSIVFGTFGNFCNIIIFTRPILRTNPCSMYFLAGSFTNLVVIYIALLTRYLASAWGYDPSATSMVWCKTRYILVYPPLSLVLWFIVLASIDRYLSSSRNVHFRQCSTVPVAWKIITIATVLTFLVFAQTVVSNGTPSCTILPNEYLVFFNIFVPIATCILPVILMGLFGILTIINIRTTRTRVIPQENNERLRANDRQLIIMLLFQVLITTTLVAPWALINMFSAIGVAILKYKFSPLGQGIFNFIFNVSRMLYYLTPAVGFYIYTLSAPKFRHEIKKSFRHGLKLILTGTGIMRYLPADVQQMFATENQRNNINYSLTRTRKGLTGHAHQR
ncbi:unnamed protein product [Adineta ricciae]|uniref:G-protein coupled receptors family 1 profile domain-containing protein n=1 Tax=Adineta ricciae TaxID=249248 RepID=A0A814IR37_ADIRI|nr:unnamed protein product [Adineta ricciae]